MDRCAFNRPSIFGGLAGPRDGGGGDTTLDMAGAGGGGMNGIGYDAASEQTMALIQNDSK